MNIDEYPKYTIIMRGYTPDQAKAIAQAMDGYEKDFAIEVTMNTDNAIEIIEDLTALYHNRYYIGAGTVMNIDDARHAIDAGARFMLGPQEFSREILDFAHTKGVLAVPAAFTPTEITRLFREGADIVKIFPAAQVGPDFFKAVQAPLGKLRLMAVGGINMDNANQYLAKGADYLGIGAGMFNAKDVENENVDNLRMSIKQFVEKMTRMGS